MKKILSLFLALMLVSSLSLCVFADRERIAPYLADGADLLTDGEEAEIFAELERVSTAYGTQFLLVTAPSMEGDIATVSEDFFDGGNYGAGDGRSGVLLYVSMNPREYYVFCNGLAWSAIDTDGVCDEIYSDMASGDYASAFLGYAEECEAYLNAHINGEPFDFGSNLLIAAVIGLIVSLIYVLVLKGQLKSVRRQSGAGSYVRQGSMNLTQSGDYFMYRNVTRTAKPQNNSSGGSSGGSSRGGSGRSF